MGVQHLSLLLLLALAAGCGSGSSTRASQSFEAEPDNTLRSSGTNSNPSGNPVGILNLGLRSAQEVLHTGDCLVEYFDASGQLQQQYREELISDGATRFSLKVIESLIPMPMDWDQRKRIREGFAFRYGSFEVRNAGLAVQNFRCWRADATREIAGQTCEQYSILPKSGAGARYEIWVDSQSGLVLAAERYDAAGVLRHSKSYETLSLTPDLSRAVWFQGVHNEQSLDLAQSLESQVGLPVLMPTLLPAGFDLEQAYRLTEQANLWVKLVYTNGIEPIFLLQMPAPPIKPKSGPRSGRLDYTGSSQVQSDLDEKLHVLELDGVTGVHTRQPEGTFEAVGIVDEQELVDMVISALPN